MNEITIEVVKAVLETWADNFVEDVPAIHHGGGYHIEYWDIVNHIKELSREDLLDVMYLAQENYESE